MISALLNALLFMGIITLIIIVSVLYFAWEGDAE